MPFDLGMGAAAFMAVAILLSAFVRGYSGFGFSALVISASGLVTNPLHFVAVVVLCEALMSLQAWRGIGPYIDWRRVLFLLAGAAVGMPLGLWALTSISEDAARGAISAYVLVMCVVLYMGWKFRGEVRGPGNLLAGVASGLANAPGMGGLPVVAFFAAQTMQAQVFRATLVAYFPLLDLYAAPLYFWSGLVSWDTLWASLMALPMVFLGNWLGSRHFLNTDPKDFRKFAIGLLALLATLGLLKAVL
ncbi:MAG: sulfite exporter TauE/SafE family protein [bacterium]